MPPRAKIALVNFLGSQVQMEFKAINKLSNTMQLKLTLIHWKTIFQRREDQRIKNLKIKVLILSLNLPKPLAKIVKIYRNLKNTIRTKKVKNLLPK